jgi:hypothetical protein
MQMNLENSTNPLDPELRSLILDYITAYNNDNFALAESILQNIRQKREADASDT